MARQHGSFLVLGAGGHGRVVADLVRASGATVVGYVDADEGKVGAVVDAEGVEVRMGQEELLRSIVGEEGLPFGVEALAPGIGDNRTRAAVVRAAACCPLPALLHPSAVVSPSVRIGEGTVVLAATVINSGVQIGNGVIINSGAIVEHDCELGDYAHVSPGAVLAGGVTVGVAAWIGAGAVAIPGIRIGADAMVGAGAVVIRDVPDGATVVGNPARIIRRAAPLNSSVDD